MLSDEEKKAIDILKNSIADYVIGSYCKECIDFPICDKKNEDCYFIDAIDTVLNLIEKQFKEIEEAEQKEKKAYIDGTNVAHELCNKYWKDKIKAKIEEKILEVKGLYERGVQPQAQYTMKLLRDLEKSLLEKE